MCLQKHDIPISAVPCLKYRRELDKERQPQQHHDSEPTASGSPVDGLYLILFKNKQKNLFFNEREKYVCNQCGPDLPIQRCHLHYIPGTAHAPLSLDWAQIAAFTLSVIGPDLSQKFDIIICLLYFQTTAMYSRKQKMYNGLGTMPSPTPELS